MMHYKKAENVEEELSRDRIPIDILPKDFLWMQVKGGTKLSNVVDYAKKALDSGEQRSVVWTGSGGGVTKTISCAEILKRNYPLHQVTRLSYRKVEEFWNPQMEGLEPIVACRRVPCVHILLSLDEIPESVPGYQHSKNKTEFWVEHPAKQDYRPRSGQPKEGRSNKPKIGNFNKKKFPQKNVKPGKSNNNGKDQSNNNNDAMEI